jgi:alkylation response protein AidB-like acyl-CoA dehydrogenase
VLDADRADLVVVGARSEAGEVALLVIDAHSPGIAVEAIPTVDASRRLGSFTFDGVPIGDAQLLCDPGPRAEELFGHLVSIGAVAASCDATGATEHVLEQAAAYAQERVQFDKPIGSFQAVKHHCANMAIAVEASRAATEAAVAALDADRAEWTRTAAVTASYVGPACSDACGLGLRIHGGIGFTWEHDSHRYLKRVKLDEVLFGTPSWHRRRLARAVFPALVGP